ncbi:MAG: hypothetical protein N2234_07890, partial [Planctomycetota bacterium]|nr:hypothetical protein [Planctomycetota bacterium]
MEKEKSLVSRSGLLLIVFVVFVLFCGCSEPIPELKILQVTESNDGMLKVKYKLRTVDGSKCSLRVSFLAQGRNWTSAKEGSGSDGTEDLTSSNDWAEHTYIWEYKTDLGPGKHNNVKLRLVPYTLRKGYGDSAGPMTIGEPLVAVSLATNDSVSFVDPVANSVIFSVTVGDEPSALAQTSDGLTLLVANKAENTVSVVSVSGTLSGSITGTIPVGNSPVALALKNDGSLAFVANSADNTVGVINIPALSSTTTIPVGSNPVAPALSPDQNILLVAHKDSETVSIVNLPS